MFDNSATMKIAAAGMRAQSYRLRIVGENVANADTPGYRRKTISFAEEVSRVSGVRQVQAGQVRLDQRPPRESHEPGHPLADARGMVKLSNVNPLIEIADAREAQRSYEANLKIFDQSRKMATSLLDLLRR